MTRERGYRGEARDRRFLMSLAALVVVMDLFESVFWLLSSAWRFGRSNLQFGLIR